jgi:hypothetical protein
LERKRSALEIYSGYYFQVYFTDLRAFTLIRLLLYAFEIVKHADIDESSD